MSPMNTKTPFKSATPGLAQAPQADARPRITCDVPAALLSVLDNYCEVTGQARSAVILALLAQHLPALDDHAQVLRQRAQKVAQLPKR